MKIFYCVAFISCIVLANAQVITTGPVVGGVTPSGARIYYSTDATTAVQIEVSTDSLFGSTTTFSSLSNAGNYYAAITDITGLEPNTRYYYRVSLNGNLQAGKGGTFKTFPPEGEAGYYKIVVGSCNYNPGPGGGHGNPNYKNDLMFRDIVDFDPNIVIHLGDWGYPPSELGADYNAFPDKRAESFKLRHVDYNLSKYILPNLPIDYTYDDDVTQNGNAGWTYPVIRQETLPNGDTKYALYDFPLPDGVHEGAIAAYFDNFPGYPQVDTSGIQHSFKLGNIEFFITSSRGSQSPVHEAFKYNPQLNMYTFSPPPGHSMLGQRQMDWLLNGLKNSTADWKVIGSGVVFNKALGNLIETVLLGQLFDRSLIQFAAALGYMWGGYPKDQNALLRHIRENNIENVIMLSGDTHSSMLDDGRNAGMPEISSSGWSAANEGYLNSSIDSIFQMIGVPVSVKDVLWNGGGNGIGEFGANYNDTYARVEFFGRDSMRACVVDEFLQTLGCMTIQSKGISTGNSSYISNDLFLLMYPNPAKDKIEVRMRKNLAADCKYTITDMSGRIVVQQSVKQGTTSIELPLQDISSGMYIFSLHTNGQIYNRKFMKD